MTAFVRLLFSYEIKMGTFQQKSFPLTVFTEVIKEE
jgi:hypothetical protein